MHRDLPPHRPHSRPSIGPVIVFTSMTPPKGPLAPPGRRLRIQRPQCRWLHDRQQFLANQTPDQDQPGVGRQAVRQGPRREPLRPGDELQGRGDPGRPVESCPRCVQGDDVVFLHNAEDCPRGWLHRCIQFDPICWRNGLTNCRVRNQSVALQPFEQGATTRPDRLQGAKLGGHQVDFARVLRQPGQDGHRPRRRLHGCQIGRIRHEQNRASRGALDNPTDDVIWYEQGLHSRRGARRPGPCAAGRPGTPAPPGPRSGGTPHRRTARCCAGFSQ